MTQRELRAMYLEAANEGFAGFLRHVQDWDLTIDASAFEQVRSAFKRGFLQGVVWQLRKNIAAKNRHKA
jgi:hypothetical protein